MQDREPDFDAGPPDPDNPVDPIPVIAGTEVWSEYDGVEIYADYTVVVPSETFDVSRMYLAGIAQMGPGAVSPEFYHGDQIGSTRAISDQFSVVSSRWTYSAFGEVLETTGSVDTRYLYGGEHGYEGGLLSDGTGPLADWPFLHVAARWYDPMSGRFLQRDPIGIRGGLNVYEYVYSIPVALIDPQGRQQAGISVNSPAGAEALIWAAEGPYGAGVTAADAAAASAAAAGAMLASKQKPFIDRAPYYPGTPAPCNPTPYPVPEKTRPRLKVHPKPPGRPPHGDGHGDFAACGAFSAIAIASVLLTWSRKRRSERAHENRPTGDWRWRAR